MAGGCGIRTVIKFKSLQSLWEPRLTRAGLQLLVVRVGQVVARGVLAGGRSDELHQVLAPTGLRGGSDAGLLPADQLDLKHKVTLVACGAAARGGGG